jgi:hypothetical protein
MQLPVDADQLPLVQVVHYHVVGVGMLVYLHMVVAHMLNTTSSSKDLQQVCRVVMTVPVTYEVHDEPLMACICARPPEVLSRASTTLATGILYHR